MKEKILIVEDEFIVANDLRIMLAKAGYTVCGIASSVEQARELIVQKNPDWVLLDITLKTPVSGIELARELFQQKKTVFIYICKYKPGNVGSGKNNAAIRIPC